MIVGPLLMQAVQSRLTSRGILPQLVTNDITWGKPKGRIQPIYGWIDGVTEGKLRDTNTSRLRRLPWTMHLVLNNPIDDPKTGAVVAVQVSNAITFAPLRLMQGTHLLTEDPTTRFLEEDFYWHVVMEFLSQVQQTANYNQPQ